jgi:hypothetical protein
MKTLTVLLILALAAPAAAQTPKVAKAAALFAVAAQAADTVTTLRASDWTYREANGLIPRSNLGLVAVKAVAAAANLWTFSKTAKRHPRLQFWLQTGLGVGLATVAMHNARVR